MLKGLLRFCKSDDRADSAFRLIDADGDGKLTKSELQVRVKVNYG